MGAKFSSSPLAKSKSDELNIVVMGRIGEGKSTLINNIFGEYVTPTGMGAEIVTRNVMKYTKVMGGVSVNLFDTPDPYGDFERTEEDVMAEIAEKTKEVTIDFIMICHDMRSRINLFFGLH